MNLFVLRHGKAHPRGGKWRTDAKRPLTREGEKKTAEVARGMKRLGLSFDLILTSPFERALRTAQILVEVYKVRKLFPTNNLVPDSDPHAIVAELNDNFSTLKNIIIVGHEPFLSGLISTLLTGDGALKIDFKKAGLCKLSIDKLRFGKCAHLEWLLTPRQLSKLGKR